MQPVALSLTLILGAMSAFGPLATDMYLPAFPVIRLGLGTDAGAVQRTLAAFFAGMALAQLVYGPLADRFGRKPPAMVGLAIFTAGSLGCALTSDIDWFTAWRFVQGIGGCAGMVMARAIVRDLTQGSASVRLMSQLMLVSGMAPILAPSIGSALLTVADWRAIFWVLALYSAGLAVVVWLGLRESLPAERRRKDGLGVSCRSMPGCWATGISSDTRCRARCRRRGCSPISAVHPSSSWICTGWRRRITACSSASMPSASCWWRRSTPGSPAASRRSGR
ncbi:MFS transporter [Siccirubricoccus deserti]